MTKEKVRELNRTPIAVLPTDGNYTVTTSFDANDIQHCNPDYVVMGMIVPAHKAATFGKLVDESGFMPSPMVFLKREGENGGNDNRPSVTAINALDSRQNIAIKEIEIIPGRHEVKINGNVVILTYSEFRILQTLAEKPGWVFSRDKLIHAIHGDDYSCTERAIDVQVTGLRKKMGDAGQYIETVRGVGYRFSE